MFLAAKCVVNFYNSNRKLWQVAVIVEFECVSYHLGMFIHKAIQTVSDSLGLGWVWETASFFFSLALGTSAQMILWSRNCTWKTTVVIASPWPCMPGGSSDQEDEVSLWRSRTSNDNTTVITSITGIIISILSGWYLWFFQCLEAILNGKMKWHTNIISVF